MKNLLKLVLIILPNVLLGDNFIINPGFELSPWDSSWLKCPRSNSYNIENERNCGKSYQNGSNCCSLSTKTSCRCAICMYGKVYGWGESIQAIQQNLSKKIVNCTIRVYHKYDLKIENIPLADTARCGCGIYLCINGEWQKITEILLDTTGHLTNDWHLYEKICFPNDTITGIKFFSYSIGDYNSDESWTGGSDYPFSQSTYYIDDVYLGGNFVSNIFEPIGLLENANFDTIPWNISWEDTIFTEESGVCDNGKISPESSICYSKPYSACVQTSAVSAQSAPTSIGASFFTYFNPVIICTLKLYYTYSMHANFYWTRASSNFRILALVNNRWEELIPTNLDTTVGWLKLEKVFNPIDTVEGIKFHVCSSQANLGCEPCCSSCNLYIDNVYISGKVTKVTEPKVTKPVVIYPSIVVKDNKLFISYEIKEQCKVNLSIYNLVGEKVIALVNEEKSPGMYNLSYESNKLSSGIYFCRFTAAKFSSTYKFIRIK